MKQKTKILKQEETVAKNKTNIIQDEIKNSKNLQDFRQLKKDHRIDL